MEIIPAIDLIDGKCVRLTQGDYNKKKVYNENPLEVARMFEDAGLKRLHLVDLDGAKAGKVINWKVLETICAHTNLQVDFGGGVKQKQDVQKIIELGAFLVTVGSVAVKNEEYFFDWLETFGADKFFLGADVKEEKIAISGWLQTSDIDIYSFINKYVHKGIKNIFCTDVSKDGMMQGPSVYLYKKILNQFPTLHLTASGGVSDISDLQELKQIGCNGAIVGKAIYEDRVSIIELTNF